MIKKILLLLYSLFSLFWLQAQSPGGVSTNLAGWYSADVSATATTWTDRSTQGNNLTGTGTPTFTNLLNFNPVATFNGTSQRYSTAATTASWPGTTTANTYYYVAVPTAMNASRFVFGKGTGTTALNGMHSGKGTTATTLVSGATSGTVFRNLVWSQNVATLVRTGFNGSTVGGHYLSNNSSTEGLLGTSNPTYSATSAFAIGSQNTSAGFWDGDIAEVIVYSGKHITADYNRIESYLALKYGITKAGNYINSSSTTVWTSGGGYDNNIAGIGRDDMGGAANSGLNQKQSQSQNTGIQPVIGNVNIASTNAANTNTFGTNLSALVWGSDTGSTSFATSFAFGNLNYRMTRIWRVQETGTVGTVKVAIPASDLSGNITFPTLVVSSDAVFNGSDTRTAMTLETLGGVQYYTATVDFTTGQFFTFAALVTAPGGIAGETLWLRADAGTSTTTEGAAVSSWANQINGDINDGGLAPSYSTNGINFNPSVTFNGTTNFLSYDNVSDWGLQGTNNFHIYSVVKENAQSNHTIIAANPINSTFQYLLSNSKQGITRQDVIFLHTGNNVLGSSANLLQVKRNGTIFNSVNNGLGDTPSTSSYSFPATSTTMFIGSRPGGSQYFNGNISELVVYAPTTHSAIDESKIQSYLALKYGITLSRDNDGDGTSGEVISGSVLEGDYVASNGTTRIWNSDATYQNNIAAIARDDASGLNQKQSQSQNSGIQPVMGNVNIAATNAANTNNFSADLSALVWGSDAGSASFATSFAFGGLNNRMARIWKVQETGTVGTVKVALPASQITGSITQLNFVVSSDATFDGSDTRTAMTLETLGGVQYYTATVDFTTGQFFTFAAFVTAPGGVTGEALWLRADAGTSTTTNGAALSQWNDQSLNANNVTQATAANQPTYRNNTTDNVNFNPVIRFDGTNDRLNGAADVLPDNTQQLSFSGVYRSSAATGNILASSNITNGPDDGLIISTGVADAVINRSNSLFVLAGDGSINTNNFISSGSSSFPSNTLTLSSFVKTGATTGAIFSRGVALTTTGSINNPMSFSNETTQLVVGSGTDPDATYSPFFNGIMGDIIVYGSNLTAAQRLRVESYLAIKYGMTLGNTSNILSYTASDGTSVLWTGNATYQNNIAGIGRDDLSALYQKQSQSVNSGSQVVMSLGTVAASNQANANTIATDKQFFIWGDDNGSLTTQVLTGNTTYTYRFTRVWKTQNTGSFAQNMTVYYPVSAFGNALPSTVALLYGTTAASLSNGTASAIAQSGTTTINGASYYAFTVPSAQVANMQFFSFAGTQSAPGGVTGESLWVKADTGTSTTTDGVAMSQWDDQSGNSNDVIQGTAANRPLYRSNSANLMNFNPTVSFDGASDFMDATTFTINSSANTLFSAIRTNAVTGVQNVLGYGALASTAGGEFRLNAATLQYGQNNGSFVAITSGSVVTAGTPLLFGSSMNNAANGANLYQNNRTITTGTINQIPSATNLVSIGSRTIGGGRAQFFNGLIPEVVTYNSLLTAVQRQRINSYLAIKYGITLDQTAATNYLASDGTTILWNGTSNAAYNQNIAGIGRDDLSALYQKQSQSVNTGSQVVMALGTAAASNLANANTIAADKQFFIWGDDNGSLSNVVATGNTTYPYRFTRVWKTQNTGTFAENMTVYYPVSAFGNASASTVALLYGTTAASLSNGTASVIAQGGTTTINGASYYAFTVPSAQVANMQFFSFAGTQTAPGGVASGLNLWVKGNAGFSTSQWLDQSGSGYIYQQNTAANQPAATGIMNFNTAVRFDGTNDSMSLTSVAGLMNGSIDSNYTQIAALNTNTTTPTGVSDINSTCGDSGDLIWDSGGRIHVDTAPCGAGQPTYGGSAITSDVNYLNAITYASPSGQIRTYRNNAQDGSATQTGVVTTIAAAQLGRGDRGGNYNGDIGEYIIYDTTVSAVERQRINSYLGIKYGVTLDQTTATNYLASDGTTILWNGTSNAAYNQNIAGIGRDDLSGLYQKQSQSTITGSQVVMALGNVTSNNSTNANTIATDKQFFIWGDDNGSLTTQVLTGNSTYSYRFTRVWKTQNTASFAQNMTVYYPVSAFGNALPATVALLYGTTAASLSNGTASAIAQSGTTTINGTSYYAFTVPSAQVANMQFFSFAGTQTAPGGVNGSLQAWVKADAGVTTISGSVSNWNDQSGNSNNFSEATNRPLYNTTTRLVNFNPSISFNGINQELTNSTFAINQSGASIFAIGMMDVISSSWQSITASGTTSSGSIFRVTGSLLHYKRYASNPSQYTLTAPTVLKAATPYLFESHSATGLNNSNLYINGRLDISGTTSVFPTPALFTSIGVKYVEGAEHYFQGSLPEIIYYSSVLNSTERLRVESYLALKYGTTLGTSSNTVSYQATDGTTNWTGNATYQNNIAGIGRDDLSALYQKQSQSVNSGSQVVMSLGTVAASNQANANTIPTDKQFFIWGDDNGSLTNVVATGNATYLYRFTRVWKTQNTGTFAENMTVYYPVSAFGNASASTVALLYGTTAASLSNGTASAIAQSGTTTINGASYYVFTVPSAQVGNMQFFSFAGTQTVPGGVAGVNLWLKADAGTSTTTNGATLNTWADQSGQRTNLATTSSGLQTFKNNAVDNINFNPAVYFDGLGGLNFGNDYIFTPAGNGGVTLFAANRPDNAVATKNNQVILILERVLVMLMV